MKHPFASRGEWVRALGLGTAAIVILGGSALLNHESGFGVWLRLGSRDEATGQEGIAHFIEHLVFKGSARRSAPEIASSLERVGGALEAFTDRPELRD